MAKLFWLFVGSIVYTYAGYPLLLTLLARWRPNQASQVQGAANLVTPHVTLLIAAYNEQEVIEEKLKNSLALDYPRECLQILVAADGSDDRTPDMVCAFADDGVELSYSPERQGKMAAINRAVPLARGEIIVFSDANNFYAPDTLRQLVAPFTEPTVGAVSGAKIIIKGDGPLGQSEGLYWRYESFIKQQETRLGTCTAAVGEILALRRSLWVSPPSEIINDDFYLAMRLIKRGYRVVYAPQARSFERVSLTAQDEITRRARIVAGRYQAISMAHKLLPAHPVVAWQIISHKFLRPLVPLAMIGALLSNIIAVIRPAAKGEGALLRLAPPINWLFLALQALFYALAWRGGRVEGPGMLQKVLYLPSFLVNSNLAALIGLYRFLTGKQTPRWKRVPRRQEIEEPRF
ncbi:MAG: glycosyltransferase family 2 protein [Ardenticatenaceae bacterium]